MEVKKKKVRVIILPTENTKCSIVKSKRTSRLEIRSIDWGNNLDKNITDFFKLNELYFISDDDEIKVGDWFIFEDNKIIEATQDTINYLESSGDTESHKKIISSTDDSLNLAKPSQSFIKKYVEKGGIDEVMVEYTQHIDSDNFLKGWSQVISDDIPYVLKVNKHNEISISSIKDSWSREELSKVFKTVDNDNFLEWLHNRMENVHKENPLYDYMHKLESQAEWVKENL